MTVCRMCAGTGDVSNAYLRVSSFYMQGCPRCEGSRVEPSERRIHIGLALRHPRSGKVWMVYGAYDGAQALPRTTHPRAWGVHRMIPSRGGRGFYVWQIRVLGEDRLLRWAEVGFGDAWDHALMESDPLPAANIKIR